MPGWLAHRALHQRRQCSSRPQSQPDFAAILCTFLYILRETARLPQMPDPIVGIAGLLRRNPGPWDIGEEGKFWRMQALCMDLCAKRFKDGVEHKRMGSARQREPTT